MTQQLSRLQGEVNRDRGRCSHSGECVTQHAVGESRVQTHVSGAPLKCVGQPGNPPHRTQAAADSRDLCSRSVWRPKQPKNARRLWREEGEGRGSPTSRWEMLTTGFELCRTCTACEEVEKKKDTQNPFVAAIQLTPTSPAVLSLQTLFGVKCVRDLQTP